MSDLERSNFVFGVGVVSTAIVAVAVTLFLILAALSPEISVDVPGFSRCRAAGCVGGGGGD